MCVYFKCVILTASLCIKLLIYKFQIYDFEDNVFRVTRKLKTVSGAGTYNITTYLNYYTLDIRSAIYNITVSL